MATRPTGPIHRSAPAVKPSDVLAAVRRRALDHARWLLLLSLAAHAVVLAVAPPDPFDLRVYWEASPQVLSGRLYDFRLAPSGLPFTYPPFAAVVFLPLSYVPWPVAVVGWHLLSLGALTVIVVCAGRLLPETAGMGHRGLGRDRVMLWVAGCLWLEPVRHTLDLGQVNLVLTALVLWGLAAAKEAGAVGAAVGVAAGVKLTPAVSGVHLLLTRQWKAAVAACVVFVGTLALGWSVAPRESVRYWRSLVVEPERVGPVVSVRNQSLRGAVGRALGHDVGFEAPWLLAALVVAALAGYAAWVAARRADLLGALVAVQLTGLLLVPISWSHHWVWCVPAMIWLLYGPGRGRTQRLAAFAAWAIATAGRVVPQLNHVEAALPAGAPAPTQLAVVGWVYAVCALLTLVAIATAGTGTGGTGAAATAEERRSGPVDGRAASAALDTEGP
ncbi:glycosyltransferase 87 family protein [Streptomyces sp. NPDC047315]|uniref:glycosyltransferase 87 family protein n=1 Tax=Streptomyces sp. NPDC047315 TaxID=3155142 RepID=UPI0033E515F3